MIIQSKPIKQLKILAYILTVLGIGVCSSLILLAKDNIGILTPVAFCVLLLLLLIRFVNKLGQFTFDHGNFKVENKQGTFIICQEKVLNISQVSWTPPFFMRINYLNENKTEKELLFWLPSQIIFGVHPWMKLFKKTE